MSGTFFIFVTGGVVSSLGKGIISSSIGKLLQSSGYRVTIQKFDPYINIDPGTLNPYEHGECYVTEDGMETDLDLGHYERFTGIRTTRRNSMTTGKIYQAVIDKERRGDYLGKTIQVVPHITDEIKRRIMANASEGDFDFIITEIGGTIGDIESAPFMEAIRQLRWELSGRTLSIHLTYIPYLRAAGELKTKPTQHSVKELQGMGIQPDILVLRTEKHLERGLLDKVAAFCNVGRDCVIQSEDLPSIYEVPLNMHRQGLDARILEKFGLKQEPEHLQALAVWEDFVRKEKSLTDRVTVGLVGKYDLQDAYKSIRESLHIAGVHAGRKVDIRFVNSETFTPDALAGVDGIVICPGFGRRGTKAYYEEWKAANPGADTENAPQRYALVELVNLHSPALEFEAIHRILNRVDTAKLMADMTAALDLRTDSDAAQQFTVILNGTKTVYGIGAPTSNLTVGSVQMFLDAWLKENGGKIDYIHGAEVVENLAKEADSLGILLPDMQKAELFPTVIKDGALPRKTFSMGHAADKRYYMECRRISE